MTIQGPKGTRDYYPKDMAWRNYLLDTWRRVSIRNGFEQVDGPIFEPLELYKIKSGDGIVSELFHFQDRGGRDLAIRPEFTPTLARMVAEQAHTLAKPIKWFCTPNFCRAERPQRGRLREFWQWNVDILGLDSPVADAECILTAVNLFEELGLGPEHVRFKISHRQTVRHVLNKMGVSDDKMLDAFDLLDRREKLSSQEFEERALTIGLDEQRLRRLDEVCRLKYQAGALDTMRIQIGIGEDLRDLEALDEQLRAFEITDWCEYDLGIVRGLAYYTGMVFEIHEVSGAERAIAGGGRYDKLIELFGGPSTPAVGFGMGDVVISLVLMDKGLLPEDVSPRPEVYVVAVTETAAALVRSIVSRLRRQGLHTRYSYKTTRSIGKLIKDAASVRARHVLILDDAIHQGTAQLKNLDSGEQTIVRISELVQRLKVGV